MKKIVAILVSIVFLYVQVGYASDSNEVEVLKSRVLELENTLAEVKSQLALVVARQSKKNTMSPQEETKKPIASKYDVSLYGYVRLDAAYDTDRSNGGNYITYVQKRDAANKDDDEFNMTVKQTRLGIDIKGMPLDDAETQAKIEVDFYGSSTSETSAALRIRRAYLELKYPSWKILAGQEWDIFSSADFIAPTLNFTQIPGDIGINRHPQLTFTDYFNLCNGVFSTTVGVLRNGSSTNDAGEDAAYPEVAASCSWKGNVFNMMFPITLTLSGVLGCEEDDTNVSQGKDGEEYDVYGGCFGVNLPIPYISDLSLKAEAWTGKNLNGHSYGGIANGYSTTHKKEIDSNGGWAALIYKFSDKLTFNLGGGVEATDSDYLADEDRRKNAAYFGNFIYKLNKNLSYGLEYMKFKTYYARVGSIVNNDAEDDRIQAMITYSL